MRKKSASTDFSRSLEFVGESIPITDCLERPSKGSKSLNQYSRGPRIGKGRHGEVYLGQDTLRDDHEVAIKVVKRSSPKDKIKLLRRNYQQTGSSTRHALNSTENSVRREIAVLKRCQHPNLAALLEVIDDPRQEKIYLIMEYISGGPLEWTDANHEPLLTLTQTRRILRDVILGIEFMHSRGILHRDIKPSNIVYTADRSSVKLIDFGISHIMLPPSPKKKLTATVDSANPITQLSGLFPASDLLRRTGTPAFLAPEVVWYSDDSAAASEETLPTASVNNSSGTVVATTFPMAKVRPPITPAIDVWSMGVTLYCLLFGHTPFNGSSSENDNIRHTEFMLYHQICTQDWKVDDTMGADRAMTGGRHPKDKSGDGYLVIRLLEGMLQKHPKNRISIPDLKLYQFILQDVLAPKEWLQLTTSEQSEKGMGLFESILRKMKFSLSKKDSGT